MEMKMKKAALALSLAFGSLLLSPSAFASKDATCKVKTNDVGTITGKGSTFSKAFEDAATQCFDRHSDLYRMKNGKSMDEETGVALIDVCANLKCEG